jgi:hypothetical protein
MTVVVVARAVTCSKDEMKFVEVAGKPILAGE